EGIGHRSERLEVSHDGWPQWQHPLEVIVAVYKVLAERGPLALDGTRERGQGGVELAGMKLDEQVVEVGEESLQRCRLARCQRLDLLPGTESSRTRPVGRHQDDVLVAEERHRRNRRPYVRWYRVDLRRLQVKRN